MLFVYPPSVIEEQMIQFLVSAQIEAAIVKDHLIVDAAVQRFPNAVLYFNIESHLSEGEWERLIRSLVNRSDLSIDIGILSYDANQNLARKYLMDIGVRGGFIQVKLGFAQSAKIMLTALEAVEARGERRFVRASVPPGKGLINIQSDHGIISGEVIDVSVVGLACRLDYDLVDDEILEDMQLRLWGSPIRAAGRVRGVRETADGRVHVIMFSTTITNEAKSRIVAFMRRVMQWELDSML